MNPDSEPKEPKIKVAVRKRPRNARESRNDKDIVECRSLQHMVVKELRTKVDLTKYIEEHNFLFDHVFDEDCTNEDVYTRSVQPMVEAVFSGAKVTCFAYGQTGSGKTHTMMGPTRDPSIPGLYLLAIQDIFDMLSPGQFVTVSFYEIYCGKLYDLLNNRSNLYAREDGKQNVCIVGLKEDVVHDVDNLMEALQAGLQIRTTGQTGANLDSSRSHAILQIAIKNERGKLHGKISFIDLAGSERGADTTSQNRKTRMDGAEINKSLLALKECIRALDQDKKHTPFRGSKLTQVLKDSFTGNCRTLMIGNIAPTLSACEHTLNTLRYADRVKELRKDPAARQEDSLAASLMLPRNESNTKKIKLSKDGSYNTHSATILGTSYNATMGSNTRAELESLHRPAKSNSGSGSFNQGNSNSQTLRPSLGQGKFGFKTALERTKSDNGDGSSESNSGGSLNKSKDPTRSGMFSPSSGSSKRPITSAKTFSRTVTSSAVAGGNSGNSTSSGSFGFERKNAQGGGFGFGGGRDRASTIRMGPTGSNALAAPSTSSVLRKTSAGPDFAKSMAPGNSLSRTVIGEEDGNDPVASWAKLAEPEPNKNIPIKETKEAPATIRREEQDKKPTQTTTTTNSTPVDDSDDDDDDDDDLGRADDETTASTTTQDQNTTENPQNLQLNGQNSAKKDDLSPSKRKDPNRNPLKWARQTSSQLVELGDDEHIKREDEALVEDITFESSVAETPRTEMKALKSKEGELKEIGKDHEKLISMILTEEEALISMHRTHIDEMVDLTKKEMILLHDVDKPGSDVDDYASNLDDMLGQKVELIMSLRKKVRNFREYLKLEENVSKQFYKRQTEVLGVYDLDDKKSTHSEDLLTN